MQTMQGKRRGRIYGFYISVKGKIVLEQGRSCFVREDWRIDPKKNTASFTEDGVKTVFQLDSAVVELETTEPHLQKKDS